MRAFAHVQVFAKTSGGILLSIAASTLMDKYLGESNKLCRAIFTLAQKVSAAGRTPIVFIDEIDSILCEQNGREHEVTTQVRTEFMQLWDGLMVLERIVVIGATNRPHVLGGAVWRRFGKHFEVRAGSCFLVRSLLMTRLEKKSVGSGPL
jgi:SpoVK/Ycf46/Vps4 family AAA+-type ATPase